MNESEIEKYLVKTVRAMGGEAYKFNSLSHRGVSDRVVCLLNGETWFIELKTAGGKLSALQKIFAQDMKRMNQKYACLWNKEQVDRWSYEITSTKPQTSSSRTTGP